MAASVKGRWGFFFTPSEALRAKRESGWRRLGFWDIKDYLNVPGRGADWKRTW
jgi:hypothetical protein